MQTYSDFKALSETRKRKLANNTYLVVRNDGGFGIRLHETEVVIHYPDHFVLNSGGWQTVTTKQRINEFSNAQLWQEKGTWLVSWNNKTVAYADHMQLFYGGDTTGAGPDPKTSQKLRKRINQYAKGYMTAFLAGDVPAPSGGDCWLCSGPVPRSCVQSHIDESYFVPRMLAHCFDDEWGTLSLFAKDYISRVWSPDHETPASDWQGGIAAEQIRKAIRKYCLRQLGMPV